MNEIIARLSGVEAFQRALKQIPPKVATRVLRATAAAGARVVRKGVRAQAPRGAYAIKRRGGGVVTPSGVLQRAIVTKFAPERSNPTSASYVVAVRKGKGKGKAGGASAASAYYARWVEEGHRIVPRKGSRSATVGTQRARRAAATGRTRPHPFFRPGVNATGTQALQAMQQKMAEELTKVLK